MQEVPPVTEDEYKKCHKKQKLNTRSATRHRRWIQEASQETEVEYKKCHKKQKMNTRSVIRNRR